MPADGSDFAQDDVCSYQDVNEIKNSYVGAAAPGAPVTGILWEDTGAVALKSYNGAGWDVVLPSGGTAKDGMIVAWVGGYFGDGSNGSYTRVLGSANTVAGANAYLNPLGWWVCDGSVPNEGDSDIWDAAGRYLPNLTDDRFIQGDTVAAGLGGANANSHTHDCNPASKQSSTESANTNSVVEVSGQQSPDGHTHDVDVGVKTSSVASVTENRPVYLGCFYIAKVK